MIAPPERKPSIKTDKREAERIVKEDVLGYVRRSYIPSQRIEELRLIVSKQMELGGKIGAVKNQIHALLERNLLQSEFDDLSDIFGPLERSSFGRSSNDDPTASCTQQCVNPPSATISHSILGEILELICTGKLVLKSPSPH